MVQEHVHRGSSTLPGSVDKLQQLQLHSVSINPEILLSCPQLTRLELVDVEFELKFEQAPGSESGELTESFDDPVLELLAVLAEPFSIQLRHLSLHKSLDIGPLTGRLSEPEPWAALTASSQLTYLDLTG